MKQILVPTDFSECSAAAFPYVFEQAELLGRDNIHITLLHVISLPIVTGPDALVFIPQDTDSWVKEAKDVATKQLTALRTNVFRDLPVTTSVINGTDPVHQQIAHVAKEHRSELIIMGTHGRSGLNRFLLGSVTEQVVRVAPCPVLLIPTTVQTNDEE